MPAGAVFPPEARTFRDERTGATVRQVTTHPSLHHHPFHYQPAFDRAMRHLVFVSHRTGKPQIFLEVRATGQLVQLSDRADLNEWSLHPSGDGRFVYFTAGSGAFRVHTETAKEELLVSFGDVPMIPPGMVADAMGTTTVSGDDRFWAVPVRMGSFARLHVIDTASGACQPIVEAPIIGHPQFHPADPSLLRYAGAYHQRLWVVGRDGSPHRLAYRRDATKKEWIVHEVWHPRRRELLAVNWPHGLIGVDVDTGAVRKVAAFNAWHPMIDPTGTLMVTDTKNPDSGLFLFDPNDGVGAPVPLCESRSSNQGDHWNTDHCPYDDGPTRVYAPQHTHPHPGFSPDGRSVVFTSDRSGIAQVYEVTLPGAG